LAENQREKVSLREYLEKSIKEFDKRVELQFRLNQESIDKAQITNDARLESMNEFRNAMKDQTNQFITKTELQYIKNAIDEIRKIIWIGVGIAISISVIMRFIE
jgi:CHASE3 domain sensor protein